MQKENTTSQSSIAAHEHRDVSTTDIPGVFVQADMVVEVHVNLRVGLLKSLPNYNLLGNRESCYAC